MEKYYFINHVVLGKLYFYIIFSVFILIFLILIMLVLRHKNNFQAVKESFLTVLLVVWLFFSLILAVIEISWLAADYKSLAGKDQMDKMGFLYAKFNGDSALFPYLKFVKNNINKGSKAYFISPLGFDYTFAIYYLYPEIKIINGQGLPDYVLLFNADPKRLNVNLPLKIYRSFASDKNILIIKP